MNPLFTLICPVLFNNLVVCAGLKESSSLQEEGGGGEGGVLVLDIWPQKGRNKTISEHTVSDCVDNTSSLKVCAVHVS